MNKKKTQKSLSMSAVLLTFVATIIMVTALTMAGNLEPTAPPGPTMKTLNEIPPTWSQTFDNASDRFELVLYDQAVLDKETGLVWARNVIGVTGDFLGVIRSCRNREIGERKGWRVPTVEELSSLVDPHSSDPALPVGYSSFFENVQNDVYWTSTMYYDYLAFGVDMTTGEVNYYPSGEHHLVWPVRGGSGPAVAPWKQQP